MYKRQTTIRGEITANKYDDSALKARVSANETAIGVLNGEGVGSVKKTVEDAVAAIVNEAPEAYDTLKEISDWISGHETDAAGMNSSIKANKALSLIHIWSEMMKLTVIILGLKALTLVDVYKRQILD